MNKISSIGFLGGGKMAQSMAKGFISAGLSKAEQIFASVHPNDIMSFEAFKRLGANVTIENDPVVQKSNVIFVSVKPNVVTKVLEEIKPISDNKLFISIAMGITLKELEQSLSSTSRVIRAMPNIAAMIQKSCSVFVRGSKADDDDAKVTQTLFESLGTSEEVEEKQLDPITALSGSGPAYVFVMIEAMADGAVKMGLPRDLAYRLASQTVLGAGHLVKNSGRHPAELKDDVTSPGGSTAAGLSRLELTLFRASVAGAVEAATQRCLEISSQSSGK
ncbi:uncharacterized protein LOC129608815 [Condylostylus longicornis]|uniref:uncharacterized protein LOC129608815 n=1 Tax=Condylostylus longicornis TaxID=2530218 RepID=UPI00244DA485|nr:uncharacterized protein LOC129608815 [Condylostylus longicornis]